MLRILILSFITLIGCTANYQQTSPESLNVYLDNKLGVAVAIPVSGHYGSEQYPKSGLMTANAIKAAFNRHSQTVELLKNCQVQQCLEQLDTSRYGYFVQPEILHWEDRATEWTGKPDRIEIKLTVFDTKTREVLSSNSYKGKSKWATFGGDHPQDLLPQPTLDYVDRLYQ